MDVNDESVKQSQKQLFLANSPPHLSEFISNLAQQSLRSSERILNAETYNALASKFNPKSPANFLQQLIQALLNHATRLNQQLLHTITRQDYQALEQTMQKSEAEIRKHIKIQQQLKLYLDGLEEKIQQLQYRLELEEEKYLVLFENFKELDQSHKKLTQQLSQATETKKANQQYQFKSIQMASNENMMSRKTKLSLKNRLIMEKLHDRTRKINERKHNKLLSITEDQVNLQVEPHPKGNSIDRYKKEGQSQYSIKELTKSLQMKHQRSVDAYNKKLAKNKTQSQKEGRSSSIMN